MTKRMLWEIMSSHHSRMGMELELLKRRVQRLELGKLRDMGYEIDEDHKVIMVPDGDPMFHAANLRANWPQGLPELVKEPIGWTWKLIQSGVDITP